MQVSEIQLSYKTKVKACDRPKVTSSNDAYAILLEAWDENHIEFFEEFKVLLLNRQNRVLGLFNVSSGGIAGTVVDPKLIFGAAIKANASSIILAHNHPSGETKPSTADIQVTKKLVEGGKLLEISVLDHVIVTNEKYFSFADESMI